MRSKSRITITLAHDLLSQIDDMIDGKAIRNRSHAIEDLLRQGLEPRVTTAAILAGGRRGDGRIAPILSIGGTPLIQIMMDHLISYGIDRIFILGAKNEERLRAVVASGDPPAADAEFVRERSPRGTLGAIKLIEHRIGPDPFVVLHGDVLTDIDLFEFSRFHKRQGTLATIAVKPREAERNYGKVMLQGNRITEFMDVNRSEGISIVNTGVYILQPEVLGIVPDRGPTHFEVDLFPRLAVIGELSAFVFQGIWFDVSREKSYQLAQTRWAARADGERR